MIGSWIKAAKTKSGGGLGKATFVTYTDAECTITPKNATVTLDVNEECTVTPDGSISDFACFENKVRYKNYEKDGECSGDNMKFNELAVGVCQEFPGPHQTFKMINSDSYDCV